MSLLANLKSAGHISEAVSHLNEALDMKDVIDHLKTYFSEHSPE